VHAVLAAGAMPVLVDCDAHTWCMDPGQAIASISPRTRAIMPVHIYGHPVDMAPLQEAAAARGIVILEDAAEAHGAEYRGRRAGSLGDAACFSFYANKIITTGEGGMVVTNNREIADRVRSYRNLGFRPERRFYHTEAGQNFRMTSLQAAIGLAQMENVEWRVGRKREIGRLYTRLLSGIPGVQLPIEMPWATNVYWMYGIVIDEATGVDAAQLAVLLRGLGVETRPFFLGMHEQPVFLEQGLFAGERYPVTERIARQGLYLPSGLTLTDEQVTVVTSAVGKALGA
jgi:perosamine synthetase